MQVTYINIKETKFLAVNKLSIGFYCIIYSQNLTVKVGGLEVQILFQLHSGFRASLGYKKLCTHYMGGGG